jgi:hypothetical protein
MYISDIVGEAIERIKPRDYEGGKAELGGKMPTDDLKVQQLPGNSGFVYKVTKKASYYHSDSYSIKIYAPKSRSCVAKLVVYGEKNFPLPNALVVDTITVDEDHRGMGLAKALYGIVLTIMKRPLVAGDAQTPGGIKNWVSLSQIPGVEMKGYLKISDDELQSDPETIDTIMGKLGGQYIGPSTKTRHNQDTHLHWFAFDVQPNTTGDELEAYVKTNLSKVYGDVPWEYVGSGLFAVWFGR